MHFKEQIPQKIKFNFFRPNFFNDTVITWNVFESKTHSNSFANIEKTNKSSFKGLKYKAVHVFYSFISKLYN